MWPLLFVSLLLLAGPVNTVAEDHIGIGCDAKFIVAILVQEACCTAKVATCLTWGVSEVGWEH